VLPGKLGSDEAIPIRIARGFYAKGHLAWLRTGLLYPIHFLIDLRLDTLKHLSHREFVEAVVVNLNLLSQLDLAIKLLHQRRVGVRSKRLPQPFKNDA
jgi:hypothetical protein